MPHRASEARTVTLDFGKPEGQELLRQLASEAGVLVENSRPGVVEKCGLGPDQLLMINPRLVALRHRSAWPTASPGSPGRRHAASGTDCR
jgi:crotonobetainyl-CoA:carnitine CoA-transferase CaiB-like acyl-CoA transferase